ncbi:MAG: cysteine desulfurase [Candidatus Komeilibacteria bacterium]|nr:cysteine desulfurase [Candidatus Komeilibacteria bacterium]
MNPYRKDFPILATNVNGHPLAYLDNGATTQRPQAVINAEVSFYKTYNANIHRGLHALSQKATEACDATRIKVQKYIHARSPEEIVFTYGTTHGINLIAYTWAEANMKAGDEVLISLMEHHANIVPWQQLAKRKKIKLSYITLTKKLTLDYAALARMISKRTKLVSVVHVSNVLGIENDIAKIISIVHKKSRAKVLVDAAQSIAHIPIDVQKMDCDFLVFSGHKMYGPTGIGVLYGKQELLETMPPFLTGGDMIISVEKFATVFQKPPARFEAGTPNIAGIIGLGAAVDWIQNKGLRNLRKAEAALTRYAYEKLLKVPGLTIYGPRKRHGVISFNLDGIHAHDVAEIVNRFGVAIRSGNHCAMPLHRRLGIVASARASIACYNTKQEVDTLVRALKEAQKIFK